MNLQESELSCSLLLNLADCPVVWGPLSVTNFWATPVSKLYISSSIFRGSEGNPDLLYLHYFHKSTKLSLSWWCKFKSFQFLLKRNSVHLYCNSHHSSLTTTKNICICTIVLCSESSLPWLWSLMNGNINYLYNWIVITIT